MAVSDLNYSLSAAAKEKKLKELEEKALKERAEKSDK